MPHLPTATNCIDIGRAITVDCLPVERRWQTLIDACPLLKFVHSVDDAAQPNGIGFPRNFCGGSNFAESRFRCGGFAVAENVSRSYAALRFDRVTARSSYFH